MIQQRNLSNQNNVSNQALSSISVELLGFAYDKAEFYRTSALAHILARHQIATKTFSQCWNAAKAKGYLVQHLLLDGAYAYSISDKGRFAYLQSISDAPAVADAPAVQDQDIESFDQALELTQDAVMCAGFIRRLVGVLRVESGNELTCAMLTRSACLLEGVTV